MFFMSAQESSSISMSVEDRPGESKKGGDINLLSDTGLARRRMRLRKTLYRISGVVVSLTLFFSMISFGFWFWEDRNHRNIQNQVLSLEQRVATFSEVGRLADVYVERLMMIKDLLYKRDSKYAPWFLYQKLLDLSAEVDATLIRVEIEGGKLEAGLSFSRVEDANKTLSVLTEWDESDLMSNLVIQDFGKRSTDDFYVIQFTADLL